jgi:DNA-binding CsgD family transcriptional regulator/tetratricopeptide (TPR) repeat protein
VTSTAALRMPPLSPLTLQLRRATGSVVGRPLELIAIQQELAAARSRHLAALTLEGEPGIGKTRLLVAASELAAAEGFACAAVTADEEIRGPFLLARAIFACLGAHEAESGRDEVRQLMDAVSGEDDPGLERLSRDDKLLRTFDLAALALRAVASHKPVAVLIDDLQWADEDSVRMLRYIARADPDVPFFLALAVRPHDMASITEAVTLVADMERMGIVRRLKLERLTQGAASELLKQLLGARVENSSAAAMHAQAEGVPFMLEELARTYRAVGMIQQIDGVWTLARNAERLVPSAVRTLIERRAARLPDEARSALAEAAVLGRTFSLRDLGAVKLRLGDDEGQCSATVLAEALAPAVQAGLLVELVEGSPADYRFTHDQVREFAAGVLTPARRRAIHAAIVDILTVDGEPPAASLPVLAHHARAAGDSERTARYSVEAARAALAARAPEEVLRLVELALPATSAAQDRVALLVARDDALDMLRRPTDRLEGLAELAALSEALRDSHLELDVMLRQAASLRVSGQDDRAGELAQRVRHLADEREDRRGELAACLELGQALLRTPLGESFSPSPTEADLDGAAEAYGRACALAEDLGDVPALAAATRELGIIDVGRARAWFVGLIGRGEHLPIVQRILAGEPLEAVLSELPIAPLIDHAVGHYERAIALFEQVGDRRGVMSSIIARAYLSFGIDIHLQGSAKRIDGIRQLATQMKSLTRQSEQATANAQMLYGTHVFARAKGVPDLALSRGEEAYHEARALGERALEFASAGGVALAHLELGEVDEAEAWLDRAAGAAAAAPTPLRARQLEQWRGMARAEAHDAVGMQQHLERAVRLAGDQGRPAARCEVLASLALAAARLGAEQRNDELLSLSDRAAREAKDLMALLSGRPPWGAQADAALAEVALSRGRPAEAGSAGRSALSALEAIHSEDLNIGIMLPAARALLETGSEDERGMIQGLLRMTLTMVAQRTLDEDVRVRWFRGPVGRELSRLAGPLGEAPATGNGGGGLGAPARSGLELAEDEVRLLWLLIEGRTNREIAEELDESEDVVRRRLAEIYARIGASSRAEAAALAFREGVV